MHPTPMNDVMIRACAKTDPAHGGPLQVYSIRMPKEVAENVMDIAQRHGITMSEFLRKCAETLVEEYTGEA